MDTLSDDFLADKARGHADLLVADHLGLLAVEPLLGDDRGDAAKHVVECVHHDALGAHAGAGHPSRRYPYPYVSTEALGPTSGEERTRKWGHIPALRQVDGLHPS
jgi:hypothetical protein